MASLAATFGRGAMTNGWTDVANADVVLVMGGNPAENHPVGFRFVFEAKRNRKAKLVVIDPRFGWGSPVLTANKVKVEDVVALWRTGEPISAVAEEYDLTETVVEDVLRQAA